MPQTHREGQALVEQTETAFKHPGCGGVIMRYDAEEGVYFRCALCGSQNVSIEPLVLGRLVVLRTTHQPRSARSNPKTDN